MEYDELKARVAELVQDGLTAEQVGAELEREGVDRGLIDGLVLYAWCLRQAPAEWRAVKESAAMIQPHSP